MTIIKDCIYRFIQVPELCQKFIDTPEFQRLRRVKQLGLAHYIYPSAVHTRLEHSLGVMHLAGLAVDSIFANAKLSPLEHQYGYTKDLVMLAGLLHDVGHMAYSHMFDDVAEDVAGIEGEHEHRSLQVLNKINARHGYLTEDQCTAVGKMILGEPAEGDPRWMYQIVCNKVCGVDVDKMDYLQRDSYHTGMPGFQPDYIIQHLTVGHKGDLAFNRKAYVELESLFVTRKQMFSKVYFHKTKTLLSSLYKGMIADAVNRLDVPGVMFHFKDDHQAETYLRREYPQIFELIDVRKFDEAIDKGGYNRDPQPEAQYVSGCNDLREVMNKIIFADKRKFCCDVRYGRKQLFKETISAYETKNDVKLNATQLLASLDTILPAFEKVKPYKRMNFLPYPYVLIKLLELGKDPKPDYSLLRSAETVQRCDAIWRDVCGELGWEYESTKFYGNNSRKDPAQ